MSTWLKDTHGVNISPGQISRALRQPELHLQRLADFITPMALYVASAYHIDPRDLLFMDVIENGPSQLHDLAHNIHKQPNSENDLPRWEELQFLASIWEPIPHESKSLLEPYLRQSIADHESDSPNQTE